MIASSQHGSELSLFTFRAATLSLQRLFRCIVPCNTTMFDGGMTLEDLRHEHSKWLERLEGNGRLHELTMPEIPFATRVL